MLKRNDFIFSILFLLIITLVGGTAFAECLEGTGKPNAVAPKWIPEAQNKFNYILVVTVQEIKNEVTHHSIPPEGRFRINHIIRGDTKIKAGEEHKFFIEMPECEGDRGASGKLSVQWNQKEYQGPGKDSQVIVFGKFFSGSIKDGFRIRGRIYLDSPENRKMISQQMEPKNVVW